MAAIHDLIEISGLLFESTLSTANGRILDVFDAVEKIQNSGDPVEEFNNGDTLIIGGTAYTIDAIYHPDDNGSRITSDNGTTAIADRGDDFADMLIIDVSNGTERRYFIIPSDSLDDLPNISSIDLGRFATAAGSDATLSSALNNAVTVCFAAGVLITTIDGEVPVEKLCVGDLILTLDEGFQPLRWIGCQALTPTDLACKPELRPIRIRAGALGAGVPRRDLVVSPHHRIFARSKIARNMFGCHEVLVAAKDLLFLDGIEVDCGPGGVDYWHLLFDKHQLIYAEGAIAESLYAGPEALKAVGAMAMRRRFPIMREAPMLFRKAAGRLARPHLKGRDARHLALKHVQKNRAMVVEF